MSWFNHIVERLAGLGHSPTAPAPGEPQPPEMVAATHMKRFWVSFVLLNGGNPNPQEIPPPAGVSGWWSRDCAISGSCIVDVVVDTTDGDLQKIKELLRRVWGIRGFISMELKDRWWVPPADVYPLDSFDLGMMVRLRGDAALKQPHATNTSSGPANVEWAERGTPPGGYLNPCRLVDERGETYWMLKNEASGEIITYGNCRTRALAKDRLWRAYEEQYGAMREALETAEITPLPSPTEHPNGLHGRYIVTKADGTSVDPRSQYFVLQYAMYDGADPAHVDACRAAVRAYIHRIHTNPDGMHLWQMIEELEQRLGATGATANPPCRANDMPQTLSELPECVAPVWIVTDSGELGVYVNGAAHTMYKGLSLSVVPSQRIRMIGKREFGESVVAPQAHNSSSLTPYVTPIQEAARLPLDSLYLWRPYSDWRDHNAGT